MRYIKTSKANRKKIFTMIIITFVLAIIFMFIGFQGKKTEKYYYIENNNVDYKVYLKENKYFESEYLEKNKTYITTLIDYIDTDFQYNVDFNKPVSGEIEYQLIAQISADKEKGEVGNYWTKEYDLSEKKTTTIKSDISHSISVGENIEYSKYNEILKKFINEYKLASESTLKIYLKLNGKVNVDNTKEYLDIDSNISLSMPLSQLAIEGTINTDSNNNQKEITVCDERSELTCFIFKAFFYIDVILLCKYIYQYIQYVKMKKKYISYRKRVSRINSDYEGIITNVKEANIESYKIIQVEEFDDLLNVYNNIREPINCRMGLDRTIYFIINNDSCYTYIINKKDYEK